MTRLEKLRFKKFCEKYPDARTEIKYPPVGVGYLLYAVSGSVKSEITDDYDLLM
jgi:hypothetical protein